ncbi:cell cycle checkpoint control protein RAD9B isoform X2 [Vanessa cardui]|uniref:cell cycle checkpoint control protein RAD9B isoform X2 n=1 Tax=Vanessa cardui TaxID=171605 RepID=UPI001F142652|nr:cell cycle checkpoint control protein RAD9B isoform X2 [Vanessa cardui]XP_046964018.1 cell cycle checkpoint control protein RAD9B isoform X2 [Vanessa cardui]
MLLKVPMQWITSSQRMLTEALSNFQNSDDQVTLEVSSQSLLMRNYIDSNLDLCKIIRTQINIKPSEFDSYIIGAETIITFTLKEFRALLAFAEALSLPLQLHFEVTGKPAVFIVHNGSTFEAHFVLATSKPDVATQASSQTSSRIDKKRKENSSPYESSAKKKPHMDAEITKCLEDDSHLFNDIEMPEDVSTRKEDLNGQNVSQVHFVERNMHCDDIPASPTSRIKIKSVFKRCFESTFDPRSIQGVVLAENSDSD